MKTIFILLLVSHGLVHLIGHYNAYHPGKIDGMTLPVTRNFGFLWLLTAMLFVGTAVLFGFNLIYWWILGCTSIVLSQFLIVRFWHDARFGTIGNVLVLFGLIVGFSTWSFHKHYRQDVKESLARQTTAQAEILTEADIAHLPSPVQKYLRYAGVIGKPKVRNFRVRLNAEMRNEGKAWFRMRSEQYNFLDEYERLFFLRARVKGIPVSGYHDYQENQAGMDIKAMGMFPIVHERGAEMFEAETVTLFNDMCILAPATLIDKNITWEEIDQLKVKGILTSGETSISAILEFNELGQLVNFVSDDRYNVERKQKIRFSTPISEYQNRDGFNLATYGEAIWHYPDSDFVYGKFKIKSVDYNISLDKKS